MQRRQSNLSRRRREKEKKEKKLLCTAALTRVPSLTLEKRRTEMIADVQRETRERDSVARATAPLALAASLTLPPLDNTSVASRVLCKHGRRRR